MGTLILGQHDTPYKIWPPASWIRLLTPSVTTTPSSAVLPALAASSTASTCVPTSTVAYISPTFSGFHAAVAYVQPKNIEAAATADDDVSAWSMMGMYENGPLFASAGLRKAQQRCWALPLV